jgi:subtilisin family serine protease
VIHDMRIISVLDTISSGWPPETNETRDVGSNCRVAPTELPGTLTVSATGPVGVPEYDLWIATYSSVGMSQVDVTAPGGDYFIATQTVQDAILAALPEDSVLFTTLDPISGALPGLTVVDQGATYGYINGTSMSTPHAAGVAALIKQLHPNWGSSALKAAVERTAQQMTCPPDWQPLDENDERERCYGTDGRTSFFGYGMVDALAAAQE